jgi:2-aminoadipate transaminase
MFLWVKGPEGYDGDALYNRAIQNNVAFVPGKYFFADGHSGFETMRLNFTMADEATIERAIKTLAGVL